jgi:hypothetical protein
MRYPYLYIRDADAAEAEQEDVDAAEAADADADEVAAANDPKIRSDGNPGISRRSTNAPLGGG